MNQKLAWSFGHSDPDLSSVLGEPDSKEPTYYAKFVMIFFIKFRTPYEINLGKKRLQKMCHPPFLVQNVFFRATVYYPIYF